MALTIPVEWAAIIIPALIIAFTGGIAHLKVVWDIRGDLRHVGEKILPKVIEDIDVIRRDVEEIKVSDARHEERISALERGRK